MSGYLTIGVLLVAGIALLAAAGLRLTQARPRMDMTSRAAAEHGRVR